ncbi:Protein CBG27450 [Caenorhabditis briggsae]|uniref:Protein CBG27450 n=1 Tax=Caenorhabditis briggsae TaxID=6238 RepID=B6IK27_CAEBR|nr:Protein CBG27450 [Caenorhabditis briggsae]CAS00257.1 Protein CBG27450 [Caenorhabditis briggsae]
MNLKIFRLNFLVKELEKGRKVGGFGEGFGQGSTRKMEEAKQAAHRRFRILKGTEVCGRNYGVRGIEKMKVEGEILDVDGEIKRRRNGMYQKLEKVQNRFQRKPELRNNRHRETTNEESRREVTRLYEANDIRQGEKVETGETVRKRWRDHNTRV